MVPSAHIPALDGIRGIAILLVMLHHFTLYGGMQPTIVVDRLFYSLVTTGWCGVDLFFVLSGFLITGILFDAKESPHFFRNFYMRRCLRIFPLYYGTLVVCLVILPRLVPLDREFQLLLKEQGWYWSYLLNVLIAIDGWPAFGALGHFWSLAVEEQFYLLWPVFVFLLSRRNLLIVCIICIIGGLGIRVGLSLIGNPTAAYVLTPARMDTLAVGALLALVARRPESLIIMSRWVRLAIGVTASALLGFIVWRGNLDTEHIVVYTIGYTLLAFLFGAILTVAVMASPASISGRIFAHPVVVFFGRYSYALYVFHHPLVFFLADRVVSVETFPRLMESQLPGQIIFILLATLVSVGFALLSWRFYEQPFLRLKNLFPYQYQKGMAKVESAVTFNPNPRITEPKSSRVTVQAGSPKQRIFT